MIEMVVDGQPRARIVVSESASPVEQHAAAELNKYIYQMSGAQLPVETTPSDDKANIYIGRATRPKNSIYQKRPWASTATWSRQLGTTSFWSGSSPTHAFMRSTIF